jgi:hypothetical protein
MAEGTLARTSGPMTSLRTFSDTQVRPGGTRNVLYEGGITDPLPGPAAVLTDNDEEAEQAWGCGPPAAPEIPGSH